MDAIIKIQSPNSIWTVTMATAENAIVGRVSIYLQTPNMWTVSVVIDCYWPTVSDWERNMRPFLNQIINGKDVIVESRIMIPRYSANDTERRLQAVLLQILEIPNR